MSPAKAPVTRTPQNSNPTLDWLVERFLEHLKYTQAKDWAYATSYDRYVSLATAVRDLLFERQITTQLAHTRAVAKRVYYLSMEYMLGQLLRANLVNLGLYDDCRRKLAELGLSIDEICELEPDAGLGNGGLGRLAACYLDSLATLNYPAFGYGIRYEYGIFDQEMVNGWQMERPDYWLRYGTPWEVVRPEFSCPVRLFGYVEPRQDAGGRYRPAWLGYQIVMGVPYDIPVPGYGTPTVNMLRLWSAKASESFDLAAFNRGGYIEAVQKQALTETISKVLYPSDQVERNRELRLVQQYFFVACTLYDILRRYEKHHETMEALPDKAVIQLNDTHPSIAIAELMRIFVDERGLEWERAWEITTATFGYTNHTLLPEALEVWPLHIFGRVLPRHLEIIFEINRRFLQQVEGRWPGNLGRVQRLSLIQETPQKGVRMANLAICGSRNVNGVAALHSELLRSRLVPDFADLWPVKFNNVTNGVTPRRWLLACNPLLAEAITRRIGRDWPADLDQLQKLEHFADDTDFHQECQEIKRSNKQRLADWIGRKLAIRAPADFLFDVQVKRIHEYKRQLLNILQVIIRYHRLRDEQITLPPRVVIFGGKSAPAYSQAKLIIKLINDVAHTINADPRMRDQLRVAFLPNYRVSLAEMIVPAADLSQQISTAGMEASGTSNMKFALNGALTIGTLDGANIEIRERVGADNFFLFGLTAEEVAQRRLCHDPWHLYSANSAVRKALDAIRDGEFNRGQPDLHRPVFNWLTHDRDHYLLMADIESYLEAQQRVDTLWQKPDAWTRATIKNIAHMGYFSSDRAIREYAEKIWQVSPLPLDGEIPH
ncbi:MAG: Maltodextrin phosphorylase [Phycisphaerae bacterium]|nr:Maltodextrin phosphorylase [Phycisphaerae bacterium]